TSVARGRPARDPRPLPRAPAVRRQQSGRRLHPRRHGARPGNHRRGAAPPRCRAQLRGMSMYALRRSFEPAAFFSDELRDVMARRLRELGGCVLLGLAVAASLAMATWSAKDPSLSHATSAPVHNLLGLPGAIAADLLMQLLGLAAIAVVLPIAVWGWRLIAHR